ncbi:type VI secretion system baseplate subunit TssK [Neptunicella marina]|uniref:Type VI secretion system baseplate subunit TssK n=1 Tax=Neptunicella marina TaxID=2125989 RepID=A0A8J6M339_9ALTE|nr:type VI secretion system baseplate subunit TssK [Neptunicella marina]MBC3766687.1 type VI secretion system baseplate subunit TssK [Neptunicella marina]
MAVNDRVVWSEGLFLRPQHFQQQDRHTQHLVKTSLQGLQIYRWGFSQLEIDHDLLKTGKFSLRSATGVLPDGVAFSLDNQQLELDITDDMQDKKLFLCLPISRSKTQEFSDVAEDSHIRYQSCSLAISDNATSDSEQVEITVGSPRFKLAADNEELDAFHTLAVAEVVQVGADKNIILNEDFIPPSLSTNQQPILHGYMTELEGMLHQRAESLAGRVSGAGRTSTEISDFLLLQAINRFEPLIHQLSVLPDLHPLHFYQQLLQISGELSTFTRKERRPPQFDDYQHNNLQQSFLQVMSCLRESLSAVLETAATQIDLSQPNQYGIRTCSVGNQEMLRKAMFVLAIKADVPDDTLRQAFPGHLKIGAVEKIAQLINKSLPGVAISPMPAAPRQIPFHAGTTYFQINTTSAAWEDIQKSGSLAFHVAGQYPGLDMSFWAVRQ